MVTGHLNRTQSEQTPKISRTMGRLFSRMGGDANTIVNLPRIEADQTPLAGDEDFAFGSWTPLLAALLPESATRRETAKAELRTAGYYQPHAWENLAALRYLAIVIPIVVGLAALLLVPSSMEMVVYAAMIAFALLGWAVPRLHVKRKAAERLAQIEAGLPDMLDMLNMCVSQGLTVLESLSRIAERLRSAHPALSQELRILTEQASVGTVEKAFQNFSDRIELPDVRSFASLIIQTELLGTSISTALSDYSDGMRETFRQRADEKANSAAFKLLFPTALCLMPAVYLFLLGPAIVELSDFFSDGGRESLNARTRSVELLNPPQSSQTRTRQGR